MAFSMIPSLFLGVYQLRMLQLVRKLRTDQIYYLFRHRQLQFGTSCVVATSYIVVSIGVIIYALLFQSNEVFADS